MKKYIKANDQSTYQLVMREDDLYKAKQLLEDNGLWARIGLLSDDAKVLVVHDDGLEYLYYDCKPYISFSEAGFWDPEGKFEETTHVYKYTLEGQTYFVELTDKQRDVFEDKYNVRLHYWRD